MEEEVLGALKKCAVGFGTSEVVEEFSVEDGVPKLIKRKVTKRDVPPDIKAVKMLLDESGVDGLSEEQLEEEKQKLLNFLKEGNFD